MDQPAPNQHEPSTASVTTTTTEPSSSTDHRVPAPQADGILRLRGALEARTQRRRVTWTEEVIDNEELGKKKTKVCCIYRKPRQFGESSSEDSDSSSSSSEDDQPSDDESRNNNTERDHTSPQRSRGHDHACKTHGDRRQRRKNAYERQPGQPNRIQ